MPPSDAGGGDGGSFFAGHQAATDNGSSSDSRLSFIMRTRGAKAKFVAIGEFGPRANCHLRPLTPLSSSFAFQSVNDQR